MTYIFFSWNVGNLKQIRWNPYLNNWQKLLREIEQFQIQWERATGNASVQGKISNYKSLKKAVKDQINVSYNWQLIHVLKDLIPLSLTGIFFS